MKLYKVRLAVTEGEFNEPARYLVDDIDESDIFDGETIRATRYTRKAYGSNTGKLKPGSPVFLNLDQMIAVQPVEEEVISDEQ